MVSADSSANKMRAALRGSSVLEGLVTLIDPLSTACSNNKKSRLKYGFRVNVTGPILLSLVTKPASTTVPVQIARSRRV
jgi:hypothetical protein